MVMAGERCKAKPVRRTLAGLACQYYLVYQPGQNRLDTPLLVWIDIGDDIVERATIYLDRPTFAVAA